MTVPVEEENAVISNVEVYRYEEERSAIEPVEEIAVDGEAHTVSFEAENLGTYAVRYTVDFYFGDKEFHMVGGATLLLSELFAQLGIDRDAADVERIDFTDESLILFTRYDDCVDWVIKSLAPFDTDETMTLIFADGERLVVPVADDQTTYGESSNLADFMTNWKLTVGDTVFSDDTVDENTVIEYKDGMQYSLELSFAEQPTLGFATPATDPPEMFYQLPDLFYVPSDFTVPLMVKLGRKGVLANNIVTVAEGSISGGTTTGSLTTGGTFLEKTDADETSHSFLKLRWNWEDTSHWGYFRDSSQANLKIIANGVFRDEEPHVLSINGKDISIRKEDLRNAIVNKEGSYNPMTSVVAYAVTVTSQGSVSDITLTDTLGAALIYQGDVSFDAGASINKANTSPQITQKTGNTFNVVIPAMKDGDSLVFRYSARVDYDKIAVSGAPTFEETGNTAQIVGDSYAPDNTAVYHETNIEFSDLEKNCVNKRKQIIAGNLSYILTWEIDTNKRAQYPLADTTITDAIGETVQSISKYAGDGVTVKCYSEDGGLQETRQLSWEDLGVDLDTAVTWTYRIPDTDPQYHYVLTYDTVVDMSGQTETVVADNTAEGKGGIDSDRAVLPPPGKGGVGVTKKATNISSTRVTWEITLTVSGTAFDYERLALTEYSGVKDNNWQSQGLPYRWLTKPGETENKLYKESLKKVEVVGLQDPETFRVTYGRATNGTTDYSSTLRQYVPDEGSNVLETDFVASDKGNDYFQLEFFKDSSRTEGNLVKPDGESPSRTVVVRLTTEFSSDWALTARDVMLANANRDSGMYSHVNWISAETPDSSGKLVTRAKDTDKFTPMPPHVYKTVLQNPDTTLSTAKPDTYLLNYPDCIVVKSSSAETGALYPDEPAFPTFRYQALVSGIQYDEPLVIEDSFDTSLFDLITTDSLPGAWRVMTKGSRQWTHTYFPKVFGMSEYGWTPESGQANYDGTETAFKLYCFGFENKNYYKAAENYGAAIEKTDTGFRVTINELFKRQDGSVYPFYGIDYYLVPKNLEALKRIEEIAAQNGKNNKEPKAPFVNTVSARGTSASATIKIGVTNDFMPIDKTSEAWLELADLTQRQLVDTTSNGHTVRETPDGISGDDIARYVMKYRVVLNKGREKLNGGNFITAEDEYSSNLSIDFNSIRITTTPEDAASKVSYDYSGNIGYFTIPDETKVVIEYEATVLQTAAGVAGVSNEVRMLQYKKDLDDYVRHGGAGGSTADNPGILVKKYASGHMEKGLNGAVFQLFEYKRATYAQGGSNTADDWTPVTLTRPETRPAIFTTHHLTGYGDGYAEISLSQDNDGKTLQVGKVYGLREITPPVGAAANGDKINYQNPHTDTFYCYIFRICADDETADYGNFVYLQDDIMTIRNTPESVSLNIQKRLSGNCVLSDDEKNELTYQVFRKEIPAEGQPAVYMPIMTKAQDAETPALDPRFTGISYDNVSQSWDINGLTAGDYLLVEYGNDAIKNAHLDWSWRGAYEWSDGTAGNFTNSAYQVYDEAGANARTVSGVPFTVTSQEIKDGEGKSVALTNTYARETVTLTAVKQWTGPSGAPIAWPSGKSVVFTLGTLDETGQFADFSEVSPITLDNKKDKNGEDLPGYAVFKNLPKYRVVGGSLEAIQYAARENGTVPGFLPPIYPIEGKDYAAFGSGTLVKVKNQMESTSISVSKAWDRGLRPENATATFRLYSHTGADIGAAEWMSTVNDITLDGVLDEEDGSFGEKEIEWRADFTGLPKYDGNGQELRYIVREIGCAPGNYEPIEEYAADGETITNRPAAVDFTVRKAWSGPFGTAWPDGERITLRLSRKTRTGVADDNFSAYYVLSSDAIVSQSAVSNNYGEIEELGVWSAQSHTLTVRNLPKYDASGKAWLYYATETKVESSNDENVSYKYNQEYRDKNNYKVSGNFAYSGGLVTNVRTSLTISKTVLGNMGDKSRSFRFTLTLQDGDSAFNGDVAYLKGAESGVVTFSDGAAQLSLKDGEWFTLLDVSNELSYAISENEDDAVGYETSFAVNGSNAVAGRTASGTLANNPAVAFINRKDVVIPTGVSLNIPAWLCMAWLSALLPLSLRIRRRRVFLTSPATRKPDAPRPS